MTKLTAKSDVKVGDEFNARIGILAKIGMAFSLFGGNGQRIGSARVVGDHHRSGEYNYQNYSDPRRSDPLPETNKGDHTFRFRVERLDE